MMSPILVGRSASAPTRAVVLRKKNLFRLKLFQLSPILRYGSI